MIHNIEHFHAELYVEILRDSFDWIVFEYEEVKIGYACADNRVASRLTAQVVTLKVGCGPTCAILVPKGKVGSGRDGEARRLDVILGISWIRSGATSRRIETVHISKVVVVLGACRVIATSPGRC